MVALKNSSAAKTAFGARPHQNVGNPVSRGLELAALHRHDRLHTASAPAPVPSAIS